MKKKSVHLKTRLFGILVNLSLVKARKPFNFSLRRNIFAIVSASL